VTYWTETCIFPRSKECINPGPAVEHDDDAILLQYPVGFAHGRLEPVGIGVVLYRAAIPVTAIHQIRRISDDEIDAVRRHLAHLLDAVAIEDGVDGKLLLDRIRVHGSHSVLCGLPMGRGTLREATRVGQASKAKGRFGEGPEESLPRLLRKSLFGEEPEKAEARRTAGRR
jgi:hypothetical protein